MDERMTGSGLRFVRIWAAAGLVVVGTLMLAPASSHLTMILQQLLSPHRASSVLAVIMLSIVFVLPSVAAVEICKMLGLRLLLRGNWESWAPVGAAFGLLNAFWLLTQWAMDKARYGALVAPLSPNLILGAITVFVFHWALGRLAAAAVRAPGGPWHALVLSAGTAMLIGLIGQSDLLLVIAGLPLDFQFWQHWRHACVLALAITVWRLVPWPAAGGEGGPARKMLVVLLGSYCLLALFIAVSRALLVPGADDPVQTLMVAVGACFVAARLYQHALQPWMLAGR